MALRQVVKCRMLSGPGASTVKAIEANIETGRIVLEASISLGNNIDSLDVRQSQSIACSPLDRQLVSVLEDEVLFEYKDQL